MRSKCESIKEIIDFRLYQNNALLVDCPVATARY